MSSESAVSFLPEKYLRVSQITYGLAMLHYQDLFHSDSSPGADKALLRSPRRFQ